MSNPKKAFIYYLGILALIGSGVAYLAMSKLGPGISTDSAMILSTAENLLNGRGLIDYRGIELTQFPPLFSVILAIGSLLSHQDVFVIGWILAVLVFGLLIWFSGLYFFDTFSDEPLLAYFGSFITFSSTSLIQISANIASDPLFLLMVIFFLMLTSAYMKTGSTRYLLVSAVLTIVACFQRYAGLSLVLAGGLIVAYRNRHHIPRAILFAASYAALTAAPILLWGYLHNAPVNGTVFGARFPAVPVLNFLTGTEKMLSWFIPYGFISALGAPYLLAAILCLLIFAIFKTNAPELLRKVSSPQVVPNIAFLLVYSGVLIFDISYYELKGINTDRVHIIALPSLLIILLSVGSHLVKAAGHRFGAFPVYLTVGLLFLVWTSYPVSRTYDYTIRSMESGDISSYNSINKLNVRSSLFTRYLQNLDVHNHKIYSNGEDSAWFILRIQANPIPVIPSAAKPRRAYLAQHYPNWPGPGNDGYLVWFNAESYKDYLATPRELASIADVSALYSDETGSIYYVTSR